MSTAAGICPRCGSVAGTWHTRPQCDAAYDSAYRAALPSIGTSVTTSQAAIDAAVAAERDRLLRKLEALADSPDDTQWWPVVPYRDDGVNDDEVVEVHVVDADRLRALVAEERAT